MGATLVPLNWVLSCTLELGALYYALTLVLLRLPHMGATLVPIWVHASKRSTPQNTARLKTQHALKRIHALIRIHAWIGVHIHPNMGATLVPIWVLLERDTMRAVCGKRLHRDCASKMQRNNFCNVGAGAIIINFA